MLSADVIKEEACLDMINFFMIMLISKRTSPEQIGDLGQLHC